MAKIIIDFLAMVLAVVTIFQNKKLKKQNERFNDDTQRNIKRPYLELDKVFSFNNDYLYLGGAEKDSDAFYFRRDVKPGMFVHTLHDWGLTCISINFRLAGDGTLVCFEHKCLNDKHVPLHPNSNMPYEWYIHMGDVVDEEGITFRISYQNIAGCKYHQDLKIDVEPQNQEFTLEQAIKQSPVIIFSVSLGQQVNDV